RVHDDLMLLRVEPDEGPPKFAAGQYSVLGLGYWEPRVPHTQSEELAEGQLRTLIRRAYSVCCPLLGQNGQLRRVWDGPELEFFITLVRQAEARPPALTPRLFALAPGDRLFLAPHFHGRYTLDRVEPHHDVLFLATGTGEAPHNAMLAELLASGHQGRIGSLNCVRYRRDLAYLATHRELERRYANYRYLPLTTREAENLDPGAPGYVGKRYLQEYFESGDLVRDLGWTPSPQTTHVYLCGNPDMIGVPLHTHDPARRYPQPTGMVELLERRGFQVDQPHEPGNIHFERYW
ncbi:MAG: ferredoxin--NADP reductase, partial [Planctomycetaceae bacterium]